MCTALELKNEGNEDFKKGHYATAWAKYNAAVQLDNSTAVYLANRAQCELKLEQFGSAIETCTEALKIDPQSVKCYYRRAIAYGGTLKYSLAVRDFQKVVSLAPNFPGGKAKLQAAQSLARYTAFQLAIKTEDQVSVLDSIDLDTMPLSDGPNSEVPGLIDLNNIDDDAIASLVSHFKDGKQLSKRMVYDVVIRASRLFEKEPTLTELNTEKGSKITVCGDTHGQFYDVLHIFEENGWPSTSHSYLFNGDFVDRGSWSTEVALLLYILKLKLPNNVWLNRGNHETDAMNTAYGFSGECKAKYKTEKVFKAFSESFSKIPVGALINEAYFVVHGGLFSKRGVTLDDLRKIDRFASKQPGNEGLVMEMLWSDPQTAKGLSPSKRGIAHMFGPDITEEFTKLNNLTAVIRSHECCDNGYEVAHDGKLITVFSAPNYCDSAGNQGAYINIGEDSVLNYVQFDASWHPKIPPMAYASGLMR